MAKERSRKLQKWILAESYKVNILHDGYAVGKASCGYFLRDPNGTIANYLAYQYFEPWIYEKYYGSRYWHGDGFSQTSAYNKAHVTVHRTIKNLAHKGLITVRNSVCDKRNWRITDKGIDLLKQHCSNLVADMD